MTYYEMRGYAAAMSEILPVKEYYDLFASRYDRALAADGYAAPAAMFALADPHLPPGARILDAGIGTGLLSAEFRQAHGSGIYIAGTDISEEMLAQAAVRNVADELHVADLASGLLPWPDHSFDGVLACGVLEFMPKLTNLFNEMGRVTKPGGLVAVTWELQNSPQPDGQPLVLPEEKTDVICRHSAIPQSWTDGVKKDLPVYYHSSHAIANALAHAGFDIEKRETFVAYRGGGNAYIYGAYLARLRL